VREFSTPATYVVPPTGSLSDDVVRNAAEAPDVAVLSRPGADGTWVDVTSSEFLAEVSAVAKGLIAAGVGAGDRVALLSKTRYEWTLIDYAIWFAGATTVPIYETSSAEQVEWILQDSAAVAIIAEDAGHMSRISEVRAGCAALNSVWSINDNAVDLLVKLGADITDEQLEARRSAVTPEDTATLIYTSGTTGRPKGCVLTHGNFMFELGVVIDSLDALFSIQGRSTLLFLPLAHVFARAIQIGCIQSRTRLGHTPDIKNLVADLGTFQPTFVLAVPRVFEKVYNSASQKAVADGKGRIFDLATEVAIEYSRATETGKASFLLAAKHKLFSKLVYGKLLAALGGNCSYAISGGAPLGDRLGHFYRGIGVTVLEGYGLTETSAALTVNLPEAFKIGTVGRPLPGTSVRVADDGELLFKGGQVLEEYWQNPAATADAKTEDSWFHSGDLGEVDDEGFVKITGRKKEILVTAGGKNVAPAVLEDRLRAHVLVDQCIVVGDGQPFIGAIVTIDPEALPTWAEANGKSGNIEDLVEDEDLRAVIQSAVDDANKAVSKAESIRKFVIIPESWTEEGGQLTPSLKLKRNVVMREFSHEVDALYAK
jgi:long-chain acyl-CoA synthetase